MNDYLVSVLLGIVEGLTEFLPVSSTAHLRISEALLHINLTDPYWKMYTIIIQLGAILALLLVFAGRIIDFCGPFLRAKNMTARSGIIPDVDADCICLHRDSVFSADEDDRQASGKPEGDGACPAHRRHRDGRLMCGAVAASRTRTMWNRCLRAQAIWIGLCQVLSAVFPELLARCLRSPPADCWYVASGSAEFSFLVSIPTMIAATGYDLLKTLHPKHAEGAEAVLRW